MKLMIRCGYSRPAPMTILPSLLTRMKLPRDQFCFLSGSSCFAKVRSFSDRIQQELDMARETQQVLLPSEKSIEETSRAYHLSINNYFETSSELGGDLWGFRSLSDTKLAVYLVDFSGHGVNAALNTFRLHALMHEDIDFAGAARRLHDLP